MINLLFKSLFGSLSLLERRLSIVMFHRVLDAPDPLLPDENDRTLFRQRVAWLAEGFNVLTLGAAVERLRQGDCRPARWSLRLMTAMPITRLTRCRSCGRRGSRRRFLSRRVFSTAA